jgi:hypothetical protein
MRGVPQETQFTPNLQKDLFVFNRGDEVKILMGAGEPEVSGVVKTRIPPQQMVADDWGYRVGLETGGDAYVRWDQVLPARAHLDRAV